MTPKRSKPSSSASRSTRRHTFASALIAAGVDVVRVSTVLGHAKVSTTLDTYAAQFSARGAHDMGDVIGAAFGGVGG